MKIFTKSDRYMLEQPKIIIISKFYQTHAKISKPTGATAPVEKVKEISSIMCTQQPPLQSCCCETAVSGMWRKQLPDSVKEAISGMPMTGTGALDSVMKRADDVYFSTRNKLTATASVSSVEVAAFRGRGGGNFRQRI